MQRIKLERPGGNPRNAKVPLAENPLAFLLTLIGLLSVHGFATFRLGEGKAFSWPLVGLAIVSGLATILLFAYFVSRSYLERQKANLKLISDFGNDAIYVSSTLLGWLACGEDWIAYSGPPKDFQRMSRGEIENFAWGNSDGSFERFIDDAKFTFPRIAVAGVRKRYWIFVPCKERPLTTMVLFFEKKSAMMEWVSNLKLMIDGNLPKSEGSPLGPSKWQLAQKSKVLLGVVGMFYMVAMFASLYVKTFHGHQILVEILPMVMIVIVAFFALAWSDRSSILKLLMSVRFAAAGGDKEILNTEKLPVAHDHLFVFDQLEDSTGIDCIPLSSIKKVTLENWESRIFEGDLKKLFKKDALPEHMILRLYLDDLQDPEREIKRSTEVAQRWYSELNELIEHAK